MEDLNTTGKVAAALLVGTAIGGVLGILFAPDKGSETRKKIVGKSEDLTDAIKLKFDDFLDSIKGEVDMVKDKASKMIDGGVDKMAKFNDKQ